MWAFWLAFLRTKRRSLERPFAVADTAANTSALRETKYREELPP